MKTIPIDKFGKDHWSPLAFIECLCVDHKGVVNSDAKLRMRCNKKTHPQHLVRSRGLYGTRLKGFFENRAENLHLPEHDDWNCVEDLEFAGLLKNIGTGLNPIFELTVTGKFVANKLRGHKLNGGMFADFNAG